MIDLGLLQANTARVGCRQSIDGFHNPGLPAGRHIARLVLRDEAPLQFVRLAGGIRLRHSGDLRFLTHLPTYRPFRAGGGILRTPVAPLGIGLTFFGLAAFWRALPTVAPLAGSARLIERSAIEASRAFLPSCPFGVGGPPPGWISSLLALCCVTPLLGVARPYQIHEDQGEATAKPHLLLRDRLHGR